MTQTDTIFIVEDDPEIRDLVEDYLSHNGYGVVACSGAADLDRALVDKTPPALIVLDVMMPGEDGLSICRRLRANSAVPIIMLTAKSDDIDRIVGLEIGADDYMAKPFNPRELLARIKSVLRRTQAQPERTAQLRLGALTVDLAARRVLDEGGAEIGLTSAEFDLLECFVERPGRVLSREQLMDWTRGREADAFDRTIDVQLSRLRKKIDGGGPQLIKTIRNQGYILAAAVESLAPGLADANRS